LFETFPVEFLGLQQWRTIAHHASIPCINNVQSPEEVLLVVAAHGRSIVTPGKLAGDTRLMNESEQL
jgi:hypothetical protein